VGWERGRERWGCDVVVLKNVRDPPHMNLQTLRGTRNVGAQHKVYTTLHASSGHRIILFINTKIRTWNSGIHVTHVANNADPSTAE